MRANPTALIVGTWTKNTSTLTLNGGTRTTSVVLVAAGVGDVYATNADTSSFISLNARM
jgi:hypothetical protein